jgi:hypothetical protein
MASEQNHDGEPVDLTPPDLPADVPIEVPVGRSDDAWVDIDGKRMRLSELVAEHREMRGRIARVKRDTRTAVTKRRAEKALKPFQADADVVVSGARELEIMQAQMLRVGRFTV